LRRILVTVNLETEDSNEEYSQAARFAGGGITGELASKAAPVMPSDCFEVPTFDFK
jgi:hypothetical protein